jgi:Primase C terminal 2 (PriCT-2)/Family of unknown function (DUF5906)
MKQQTSSTESKPCLAVQADNLPEWMRDASRWLVWKSVSQKGKKPRKVPYYVNGEVRQGELDSPEDIAQLGTFDEAMATLMKGGYTGIGFALGKDGDGYWQGIDFDDLSAHPENENTIFEIELGDGAYIEVSPNGDGKHVLGYGQHFHSVIEKAERGIEAYAGGRFFTVTGQEGNANALLVDLAAHAEALRSTPASDTGTGNDELARDFTLAMVTAETVEDIRSALPHLAKYSDDNADWVQVGYALKTLAQAGFEDDALAMWHEFSAMSPKYEENECDKKWGDLKPDHSVPQVIFKLAKAAGWVNPRSLEGRQQELEAIRDEQRKRNAEIGHGVVDQASFETEIFSVQDMVERFVFDSNGSRVSDLQNPHFDYALADFRNLTKASVVLEPVSMPNGGVRMKKTPVADKWLESGAVLKTVHGRTFKAGGASIELSPTGTPSFNTWRPYNRRLAQSLPDSSKAQPFIDHVAWLFGNRTDDFLDWLAHIEQRPDVLPHTAWLHIAERTGMGRNWFSGVLCRMWRGNVAANFNLVSSLGSDFNGDLSKKVLAQVDELNEGSGAKRYNFSEKLKSMINCEERLINPKYGRQSVEYNACRFLMFSNHLTAIPLDDDDRRIEVVICNENPRSAEYYQHLYSLYDDPEFIAAVAKRLGERDLSGFNSGRRAQASEAKRMVIEHTESEGDSWARRMVELWPFDVVPASFVASACTGDAFGSDGGNRSLAHIVRRHKIEPFVPEGKDKPAPLKIGGHMMRLNVLRNHHLYTGNGCNIRARDAALASKKVFEPYEGEDVRAVLERLAGGDD